jgi:hypothetical protein
MAFSDGFSVVTSHQLANRQVYHVFLFPVFLLVFIGACDASEMHCCGGGNLNC